jgi:hypothetical protein
MRLNLAGVLAGALLGFAPAAVVILPHAGARLVPVSHVAPARAATGGEVARAIHTQSGRQAYCRAWPGNPGQYWCSDYGGQRCFYALFAFADGRATVQLPTASRIPCKFGQYDLRASPARGT